MNAFITTTILLFVPSELPTPRTWEVDGVKREAIVFAPSKKTNNKVPLLFDFHGHGGKASQSAIGHRFQAVWPEAVVVYMQGLNTPGKLTDPEGKKSGWQAAPGNQNDRDLKFFDAVLASMKKDYSIDENRIYATGHSNGGGFTYLLWAKRGDNFAAFAPVAAGTGTYFIEAKPKPKPVFHAASEKDPLVTYAMQKRVLEVVKKHNSCDEQGKEWAKDCICYPSKSDAPVVVYLYEGGHKYPKTAPELIVQFFKEHPKK